MAEQIPWDWLSAQQRLGQGRISDPSQDRISASDMPDWWWEQQRYRERQTPGLIERPEDVSALPFGDLADPVSQAAFLMAPGMVRGSKALLESLDSPSPSLMRRGMLGSQRGNLGPPPVSATGEALPESMVRDETGQLKRLYHGTSRVFPDFEMQQAGSGAGGDLYGPGIYMTESPRVSGGYSLQNWTDEAKDAFRSLETASEMRDYHLAEAAKGSLDDYLYHTEQAQQIKPLTEWPYKRLQKQMEDRPWQFNDNPNIRPVYADLKRPFDLTQPLDMTLIEKVRAEVAVSAPEVPARGKFAAPIERFDQALQDQAARGKETNEALYHALFQAYNQDKAVVNNKLKAMGYDGIAHIGGSVTGGQPHRVYIAFSPEHVYPSVNVDALRGMSTKMK